MCGAHRSRTALKHRIAKTRAGAVTSLTKTEKDLPAASGVRESA